MKEKIPTTIEKKIVFEGIAELIEPLEKILESLNPSIETGDFDLIVGIDASGRIPALAMGQYIERVYKERGYPAPTRRFMAGSAYNFSSIEEQIIEWNPQKKVLIVEDTIVSGSSIERLCKILKGLDILFDIVSIGQAGSLKSAAKLSNSLGAEHVYIGMKGEPYIYGDHFKSGVYKNPGEIFSQTQKKETKYPEEVQDSVNQSREDVGLVVDELMKWRSDNNEK